MVKGIVHVSHHAEVLHWENVFRVLGVGRARPLLAQIGVPAAVAARPEGVAHAAAFFWERKWAGVTYKGVRVAGGIADPDFAENYRQGVLELLERSFAEIADFYDEAVAANLYDWARRFFVDQERVGLWDTWSILFSSAHHSGGGFDPASFGFSAEAAGLIGETLGRHFGPRAVSEDAAALDQMKGIPLSPAERQMVALEATRPGDLPEVDLHELLSMLIRYEHAYRSWVEMREFLSADNREALLWWGYRQAELLNMPVEDVTLPDTL